MEYSLFWSSAATITPDLVRTFLAERHEETEVLDYKGIDPAGKDRDRGLAEVIDTIAAMANTDGGIILFGVLPDKDEKTKPGTVVGVTQRDIDSLKDRCRSHLQPPFVPETIPIVLPSLSAGRLFVVIRIDPLRDPRPIVVRERGVFVRVGDSSRIADLHRLRQLFAEEAQGITDVVGDSDFSPSSYVPPEPKPDLVIRAALIGHGVRGRNDLKTSHKANLVRYLSNCVIAKAFFPPQTTLSWQMVQPQTMHQFMARYQMNSPAFELEADIEFRFFVGTAAYDPRGVFSEICVRRLSDTSARPEIWPIHLRRLYEWIRVVAGTVIDPDLYGRLPPGLIHWSPRLCVYVVPDVRVDQWFDFGGLQVVRQRVGEQRFESGIEEWQGWPDQWSDRLSEVVRDWLNDFYGNAGCIGYEDLVNNL